jgi:hypothetical protein
MSNMPKRTIKIIRRADDLRGLSRRGIAYSVVALASIGQIVVAVDPVLSAEVNHCNVAPPGVLAWWPGDGNARNLISGRLAVLQGGTRYAPAYVDFGFSFNGLDDRISLGEASISVPWTATVWVNRQDSLDSSAVFLSSAVSGLKIEQIESNRRVGITRYFVKDWSFNYSVPKGMWTHLAFVAGDGVTRLYVNGLLEDSIPATVPLPLTEMGKRTLAVPGGAFKGILDEVIVFNRALRSDEILQIYGSSRSGLCKPPIFEPINGQALAFHVIGPVGKRLAFSESRDLRTWTPSFTTNNPGGTIDISLVPTNSGAVFLRAQTME